MLAALRTSHRVRVRDRPGRREAGERANNAPILTQIKVPTSADFSVGPSATRECEVTHEIGSVCAQHCCCNNCAQHSNQSPKLSVVRVLQRERWHKLRLHNV